MKRKMFYLLAVPAMYIAITACSRPDDPSVTINGVQWATRNVGAPGTFVADPADSGEYYDFDEAQSVCPDGWRTPTKEEFESLHAENVVTEWTSLDGMDGTRFAQGDRSIFLPATVEYTSPYEEDAQTEMYGSYWSGTAEHPTWSWFLLIDREDVGTFSYGWHSNGFLVRCVRR